MTTGTLEEPAVLDNDTVRELTSFASQIARKLRLLTLAGREDSDRYRELAADRAGALEAVRRSREAGAAREAKWRSERARQQEEQERREQEHKAEVARSTAWLSTALASGARVRDELLRAAEVEAGLAQWIPDDNKPMSRPGYFRAAALLEAARALGVVQRLGEGGAAVWATGWVAPYEHTQPLSL